MGASGSEHSNVFPVLRMLLAGGAGQAPGVEPGMWYHTMQLVCVQYGMPSVWYVFSMACAQYGMRSVSHVFSMACVQYGQPAHVVAGERMTET